MQEAFGPLLCHLVTLSPPHLVIPRKGEPMAPMTRSANSAVAPRPRVLVVEDEAELVELITAAFGRSLDCRLVSARNLGEARDILEHQDIELLVTDVHLPDGDGTSLLPILRNRHPQASAIVITGEPSVDGAITALRNGAVDFVLKPFVATDLAD